MYIHNRPRDHHTVLWGSHFGPNLKTFTSKPANQAGTTSPHDSISGYIVLEILKTIVGTLQLSSVSIALNLYVLCPREVEK